MPRLRSRVDRNQKPIVAALRLAGWSVLHLHQLGKGAPDILAAKRKTSVLMEIKMPGEKLTLDELEFHAMWHGHLIIAHSETEAVESAESLL